MNPIKKFLTVIVSSGTTARRAFARFDLFAFRQRFQVRRYGHTLGLRGGNESANHRLVVHFVTFLVFKEAGEFPLNLAYCTY